MSAPDYERAVGLLRDPPEWLLQVMAKVFPSPFEQEGDSDEPFRRMLRVVAEAALDPPE
jgi:hypothetical protein